MSVGSLILLQYRQLRSPCFWRFARLFVLCRSQTSSHVQQIFSDAPFFFFFKFGTRLNLTTDTFVVTTTDYTNQIQAEFIMKVGVLLNDAQKAPLKLSWGPTFLMKVWNSSTPVFVSFLTIQVMLVLFVHRDSHLAEQPPVDKNQAISVKLEQTAFKPSHWKWPNSWNYSNQMVLSNPNWCR